LGKLKSDWGWLVSNKILEGSNRNVVIEKWSVALLGKLKSDWGWLVGDEVLKCSN
jgi:uncharacterized protein YjbJ (UPF0337 family)